MRFDAPVTTIKGVGEKYEKSLANLGVYTVGDILLNFPRDYVAYPSACKISELRDGTKCAVLVKISNKPVIKKTRSMDITLLKCYESGAALEVIWFRQPYIANSLKMSEKYVLFGNVSIKNGICHMEHPEIFKEAEYNTLTNGLTPVYSLTKGISNKFLIKSITQALAQCVDIEDYLPENLKSKNGFVSYKRALNDIHFPDSKEELIEARGRLVYDEFFIFIMLIKISKLNGVKLNNPHRFADRSLITTYTNKLPFKLTSAQKKALNEILDDFYSPYLSQRLLQGDVGSGKTIVAFLCMLLASYSGYQSAIMAPTDVLARQHQKSMEELLSLLDIDKKIILLTGSLSSSEKRKALNDIKQYDDALIIGTHALIQDAVEYKKLALVITDEQHRFGVKQRETFFEKGLTPHVLVMSATPIPRTLAVILYGDLDISVIDELPGGRLPIKSCVVGEQFRNKTNEFIIKEVRMGHQVYIICPLVESSENYDANNVIDYTDNLKKSLPDDIRIDYLHGKMKDSQKNKIMGDFIEHQTDVLVSTTVIEVGINVGNATVIVIENADRFGLATLHQLRGRVGRSNLQSYCIMINSSDSEKSANRLEIMNQSNDGFYIASEDLKMRGPGDFFGIRQSGDLSFMLADIYQDSNLLIKASEDVTNLLNEDPELESENNYKLKKRINLEMLKNEGKLGL